MKLLLSLVCLLFGMSICACAHLGIEEDSNDDYSDDYEVDTIQEETDGENDDNVGDGDGDDDDDDVATSLMVRRAVPISSGDTITIQIVSNMRLHVHCYSGRCGGATCPGMYFDPWEYRRCWGEVWQVYRAAGPGQIRVGDDVGFYFPAKRGWMSAVHHQTNLAPCPGVPRNSHHRINLGCWGEVFKIYARGKRVGQPIDQLDHVMIYYPRSNNFLAYPPTNARADGLVRSTCPGRYGRPPRPFAYDHCFQYVFEIHKKLY